MSDTAKFWTFTILALIVMGAINAFLNPDSW
jgi:hypothetical protein